MEIIQKTQEKFLNQKITENKENPDFDIEQIEHDFTRLNKDLIYDSDLEEVKDPSDLFLYPIDNHPRGVSHENTLKNLPIKIAILGRPNVGKSTLMNRL